MTRSKDRAHQPAMRAEAANGSALDRSVDVTDPYMWALRDLERKRAEIDKAVNVILKLRPQLRRREVVED